MNKNTATQLLKKYAEGSCSPQERALVDRWYLSEASKRTAIDPKHPIAAHNLIWKGLQAQLSLNDTLTKANGAEDTEKASKTVKMIPLKWIAAASMLLVASFVFYRLATSNNHETLMAAIRKNDIAPGKNTATLTLPNGNKINLSESKTGVVIDAKKLAYNDGEELNVSSTASDTLKKSSGVSIKPLRMFSRKMMNVSTPRGGTYQVVLPDGSKVWLNAASSLMFPQEFAQEARVVMLVGEAYFEIAKNPERPFRVLTIGQHVNVLGTHFNVNAYRDESAPRTTLVEGSVNVFWANKTAILKPGQQAVMENKSFKVSKVNADEVLAWKNGKFRFADEDIRSIMRKISRWYDVDIEYRGEITKERFGGQVSKFSKVSDILEVLQLTGYVHFKIENQDKKGTERRIIVLP